MAAYRHDHRGRLSIEDMAHAFRTRAGDVAERTRHDRRPPGVPLSSRGRDTRRLFTPAERAAVAARQHHIRGAYKQRQGEGAPRILPIFRCCGFAMLAAASGAGKALFAGSAFAQLLNTDDVGRVVWFVPTRNLRLQIRNELAVVGV
jgi:hypothetical protein